MPISEPPIAARSNFERLRTADSVPMAMPMTSQTTAAPTATEMLAGRRSKIWVFTGMLFW